MAWRPGDPERFFKVRTVWPDIRYAIARKRAVVKKAKTKKTKRA